MTEDEIFEEITRYMRDHKLGARGSIHQEPYKHDFFELFAEAYNAGMMMNADELTNTVLARAPELVEGPVWESLRQFWRDWTYAWDHAAERDR